MRGPLSAGPIGGNWSNWVKAGPDPRIIRVDGRHVKTVVIIRHKHINNGSRDEINKWY